MFALVTLRSRSPTALLTTGRCDARPQRRAYRSSVVLRFLVLMPLEMIVYRPMMAWARIKGTWRFTRGDKAWHKFERNVRTDAA